jgi:hypothetical protein
MVYWFIISQTMSRISIRAVVVVVVAILVLPLAALAAPVPNPLGDLISDTYTFAQTIVGICAFFMLVYAGFQLMLGKRDAAIAVIKDVVIGVILLFSAYIILYSINHDLVRQQATEGLPQRGQ